MNIAIRAAVIAIAFVIGGYFGGRFGSVACGFFAFLGYLLYEDKVTSGREFDGFWLRHRVSTLHFGSTLIGIIVATYFLPGWLGTAAGIGAGVFASEWLAEQLGWSGQKYEEQTGISMAYVAILYAVATADRDLPARQRAELCAAATRELRALGIGGKADVQRILAAIESDPPEDHTVRAYIAALPDHVQATLHLDLLRVIYSAGEASSAELQWIRQFYSLAPRCGRETHRFFSRTAKKDEERFALVEALGLSGDPSVEEVKRTYQQVVRELHPDKLREYPEHARRVLEGKFQEINRAYSSWKKGAADQALFVLGTDGSPSPPSEVASVCTCWVCRQKNRLSSESDVEVARCGSCHALLAQAS